MQNAAGFIGFCGKNLIKQQKNMQNDLFWAKKQAHQ